MHATVTFLKQMTVIPQWVDNVQALLGNYSCPTDMLHSAKQHGYVVPSGKQIGMA